MKVGSAPGARPGRGEAGRRGSGTGSWRGWGAVPVVLRGSPLRLGRHREHGRGGAARGGGRLLAGLGEGARGLGGELGHYRTHALDGVLCTCGASGCWERYAATTALVRAAQPRNHKWRDGRAIFESAHAGDPIILTLLEDWTDEIAQGLAGLVHIFNPQLILIGGGVSAQQELLIEPIARKVRASIMPAFAEGLEIRAAQLHNDAGMVGAVYYFRQSRGEN